MFENRVKITVRVALAELTIFKSIFSVASSTRSFISKAEQIRVELSLSLGSKRNVEVRFKPSKVHSGPQGPIWGFIFYALEGDHDCSHIFIIRSQK